MSRFALPAAIFLGCGLVAQVAVAANQSCTPDVAWSDVPSEIRTQITKLAGGQVSPQGGSFNPTDVVSGNKPRARFFGACRESDQWTIAIERGGIGYHMQVFKFSGGALADKWTDFVPPGGFTPAALVRPDER